MDSIVLILPGLGNSGPDHWQTNWQSQFGFQRVNQRDWETPDCREWIDTIQQFVDNREARKIILVGHSLACCAIVYWAKTFGRAIKGALLVAPSDTEGETYPPGTTGFIPMPDYRLPFPSIVITSQNDPYVSLARAEYFANCWGSRLINVGDAGHINVTSGYGPWPNGLKYLRELAKM